MIEFRETQKQGLSRDHQDLGHYCFYQIPVFGIEVVVVVVDVVVVVVISVGGMEVVTSAVGVEVESP